MDAPSPDDPEENLLVKLTSLVILGAGLLALFFGHDWFWIVFALGFAVLVPIVKLVSDEVGTVGVPRGDHQPVRGESEPTASQSKQEALDALRDRYARGELTETEFERKVETLLETETLEDARERVEREVNTKTEHETGRRASTDTGRTTERR